MICKSTFQGAAATETAAKTNSHTLGHMPSPKCAANSNVPGSATAIAEVHMPPAGAIPPMGRSDQVVRCVAVEGHETTLAPEPDKQPPGSPAIDWRALVLDRYNRVLRKHTAEELELLEASLLERGFSGRIYTDEQGHVLDGNAVLRLCREHDIEPRVEVVPGLTENQKEIFALDRNAARRQLSCEESNEARDRRIHLALVERQRDPKRMTLGTIAKRWKCALGTVTRMAKLLEEETGVHSDARRRYDDAQKAEAVRMHAKDVPVPNIAKELVMTEKAVRRAVNAAKRAAVEEHQHEADLSVHDTAEDPEYDTAEDQDEAYQHDDPLEDETLRNRLISALGRNEEKYREDAEKWRKQAGEGLEKRMEGKHDRTLLRFLAQEWEKSSHKAKAVRDLILRFLDNNAEDAEDVDAPAHLSGTVLDGRVQAIEPEGVWVDVHDGKVLILTRDPSLYEVGQPSEGDAVEVRVQEFEPATGRTLAELVSIVETSP